MACVGLGIVGLVEFILTVADLASVGFSSSAFGSVWLGVFQLGGLQFSGIHFGKFQFNGVWVWMCQLVVLGLAVAGSLVSVLAAAALVNVGFSDSVFGCVRFSVFQLASSS